MRAASAYAWGTDSGASSTSTNGKVRIWRWRRSTYGQCVDGRGGLSEEQVPKGEPVRPMKAARIKGRFAPGHSGNPSGRPARAREFEELVQASVEGGTKSGSKAIDTLVEIMTRKKSRAADRIAHRPRLLREYSVGMPVKREAPDPDLVDSREYISTSFATTSRARPLTRQRNPRRPINRAPLIAYRA